MSPSENFASEWQISACWDSFSVCRIMNKRVVFYDKTTTVIVVATFHCRSKISVIVIISFHSFRALWVFAKYISSLSFPFAQGIDLYLETSRRQNDNKTQLWRIGMDVEGDFRRRRRILIFSLSYFFFFFSASALFMSKWGSSLSAAAEANELFSAVLRVSQHWQVFVVRHHHHRRLRRRRHSQTVESKYFYFKTRHFSGVESNENLRVKWRQ